MVAGNRGFLPVERREDAAPSGTVIRRIPLVGPNPDGAARTSGPRLRHLSHDYYAFWLKARTSPLVEEFADILASLFA
ncbi:MAG: hypothetical protein KHY83_02795 [Coriobacteriia bacterium]|nr:hypothetical protein [Coriobacteriia bacterium]MBS5477576.1 hypothetical protein [Coriobacteriia bacterium]